MSPIKADLKVGKRQECEVWSRVCGYMRPVNNFNDSKKQEFIDRKTFQIN
jgi:ribonucleoside-triphosphate reductase (formate)